MNIIKLSLVVCLTFLSVYSHANELEIYNINSTLGVAEDFSKNKVNQIDNEIRNLTETPDNENKQTDSESIDLNGYFERYADSNHDTQSLEELSKFCINANANNAEISVERCMNGQLHPDGKTVKSMLDSIQYHYLNLRNCLNDNTLKENEIQQTDFDDYFKQNYTHKNIGNCDVYGYIEDGKVLPIDIPQTITKQGSGFSANWMRVDNHDIFIPDDCETGAWFCNMSRSEKNQALNDYITEDCDLIEAVEDTGSYNYKRYCASYFNHNIHRHGFNADGSRSTREAFGYDSVYWVDEWIDGRFELSGGLYYYVRGNTYNQQNIRLNNKKNYMRVPNPDYETVEFSSDPLFYDIPENYKLSNASKNIVTLYKAYFNSSIDYNCVEMPIQYEKNITTFMAPTKYHALNATLGVDGEYILDFQESDLKEINIGFIPVYGFVYNNINTSKATENISFCYVGPPGGGGIGGI